jgi:hypothetical protein
MALLVTEDAGEAKPDVSLDALSTPDARHHPASRLGESCALIAQAR